MKTTKHYRIDSNDAGKILASLGLQNSLVKKVTIILDATSDTMQVKAEMLGEEAKLAGALECCNLQESPVARRFDNCGKEFVEVDGEKWYR